jgi:hypothetical protein
LLFETDLALTIHALLSFKRAGKVPNIVLIAIPLTLSLFTHLWNPIGFPAFWVVEAQYMQRAMHVLEGYGVHEPRSFYEHFYDHPFFGQIFLAGMLKAIDYPSLISPKSGDIHSIEMLYLVPRLLIGALAIVDTLLVYKIAERRYNKTVAFIAAVLFAVMPVTWILRKILLDSLLLPFLLSSVLFAVPGRNRVTANRITNKKVRRTLNSQSAFFLFSGIFLGLAIFTKIPIAIMIPFVAFLVYTNSNRKLKTLALWFTPVILIPAIWPLYSISVGEFDEFLQDTLWQTQRHELQNEPLHIAIKTLFMLDPVLVILGFAGLFFVLALRKDLIFIFLWVVPFLAFLYFLGYVQFFYIVPIIPVLCISAGILINDLSSLISRRYAIKARNSTMIKMISPYLIISAIAAFGLLSTTILITTNINSPFFESYAFIDMTLSLGETEDNNDSSNNRNNDNNDNNNDNNDKTGDNNNIVIGPHWSRAYYWIPYYVFDRSLTFKTHYDSSFFSKDIESLITQREKSGGIMVIDDGIIQRNILAGFTLAEISDQSSNNRTAKHIEGLQVFYNATKPLKLFQSAAYHYDNSSYPYTSMSQNKEINTFEVRTDNFAHK